MHIFNNKKQVYSIKAFLTSKLKIWVSPEKDGGKKTVQVTAYNNFIRKINTQLKKPEILFQVKYNKNVSIMFLINLLDNLFL